MTREEARKTTDYAEAMSKIRNYRKGFKFTVDFQAIRKVSEAKVRGMEMILQDACKLGLIESLSFDFDLLGNVTSKTYRRTEVDAR